ncbi:serine/threonine protein kinase [Acaryochloris marina]|uniref:non-specific serine/threonine protein kinase n=1 Tax=Acaryochloris marina (strain MBIC 11017) TaxID=329726 RepID=B0CDU9_ACAM1|nr:serine/threonine-protein kinase [Acaryochloris marina]ABW29301.1 serine/threonine protein kinase [Acaryochloris marina MBIC11017]BDM78224.1 serine/threonine protein kinase [Acaryochloris marina MBIC10699]
MITQISHQIGDLIAERYRVRSVLGQGSTGITFAVEDVQTHQQYALKALSLKGIQDWKQLELFEREANVLSQLDHPSIPHYIDYFQTDTAEDRCFYIVQELAPGKSLACLVEDGWRASQAEVRQLALKILETLQYLHELHPPIIHRDIKPQNIIRNGDGQFYLVDFGAVQNVYYNTMMGSTVVGTYGYMAPEHFQGKAVPATDLYSLGATLLALLTHCSPAELPRKRLKIDFRSVVRLDPAFANWLDHLIEPAVEDRFVSARNAIAALRQPGIPRQSSLPQKDRSAPIQPVGSNIQLHKTQTTLTVHIPPVGWHWETLKQECLQLWVNVCVLVVFLWAFKAAMPPLIFGVAACLGGMIGIGMLNSVVFAIGGHTHLKIAPQAFRLSWRVHIPGLQYSRRGRTVDLIGIKLTTSPKSKVKYCTLFTTDHQYSFGTHLSPSEQAWLVEVIGHFLRPE